MNKNQQKKLLLLVLLLLCGNASSTELRVAVAANFLATLKVLVPVYEQQTGVKLIISSGSTGKLYAQIMHGAPYDVLLSADTYHPEQLVKQGKGIAGSRYIYARGILVLWSRNRSPSDASLLLDEGVKHIAIANPKTAPYGKAAQQAMIKMNVYDKVAAKLVQGESVGQAFQFIASGNAPLGFVALSQVLNKHNDFNKHYWPVPLEYYSPIEQQAIILTYAKQPALAEKFINYLRSDQARAVMSEYGYR